MKYTASIRYQKDVLKYIKVNNPEKPKKSIKMKLQNAIKRLAAERK